MKIVAIVLAGGNGTRMKQDTPKQYLTIAGKPLLYYSLKTFQESILIDEIILVTKSGEEERCKKEFVEQYGFTKVVAVVAGGKERYHSVFAGLQVITSCDYVMIHDGARPLLTTKMISDMAEGVQQYQACVLGVPVKDTIQMVDEKNNICSTPKRSLLWQAQTPQAFSFELVRDAYKNIIDEKKIEVTDDAMVVSQYYDMPIHMILGDYTNIKVTTPEDIQIAEAFLLSCIRI